MNKQNIKFKDLHHILLGCCLFFVILYFFNHNFSKPWKKAKAEKHHEYVLAYNSSVISENHQLKIFRTLPFFLAFPELNRRNSEHERKQRQITASGKNFLHIKILLKLSRFNLYYASGFHVPPLAA
jgi:hypothetical protein